MLRNRGPWFSATAVSAALAHASFTYACRNGIRSIVNIEREHALQEAGATSLSETKAFRR
jgi:hypothetical protein